MQRPGMFACAHQGKQRVKENMFLSSKLTSH